MNKVILMGRLVRDPELRTTQSNIAVCTFTLAVDRRFKNANGERQADFIQIVAWRQQAEFASRYFKQGSRMAVVGSLQTRTWDDAQGNKRYTTEVQAEEVYFADSKRADSADFSQGSSTYSNDRTQGRSTSANPFPSFGERTSSEKPSYDDVNDDFFADADDDTSLPFEI